MADYPSIERLAQLQQLIADFAKVERVPHLADIDRPENDAEHSFGLAITCWYLHPKIAAELDLLKILQYALSHDIVEVHAGDTFVFDQKNIATKATREASAVKQLREDFPDFTDLSDFTEGYMNKVNEEAKFVKAVDKLLPVLMIELGEADTFWRRHNITLKMEKENKVSIRVSDIISPYYEKLLDWLDERGNIPKE